MTTRLSKLVLAAVLASSVPAAASSGERDHDRAGCPPGVRPPVAHPVAPPPAPYAAYPAPPAPRPAPRAWPDARWRERELLEVRAELRALDAERARFHAEYGHRPGKVRRFERWYAARRAELERRWHELQWVAWR
jgi:hypothetical protein